MRLREPQQPKKAEADKAATARKADEAAAKAEAAEAQMHAENSSQATDNQKAAIEAFGRIHLCKCGPAINH